jgi:hypothetical protein
MRPNPLRQGTVCGWDQLTATMNTTFLLLVGTPGISAQIHEEGGQGIRPLFGLSNKGSLHGHQPFEKLFKPPFIEDIHMSPTRIFLAAESAGRSANPTVLLVGNSHNYGALGYSADFAADAG